MKIVVYCDEVIERRDLRRVVGWEKGVKRGKTGRKEQQGCEIIFHSLGITS